MDKTFCVFGDSVTQAAYIKTGWVDLLRNFLEEKYPDDSVNVFNLGIGGNTSSDIVNRFKPESAARNPTDIVFAFGVNDSGYFRTLDKPIVQLEEFVTNVQTLITQAKEFTQNITFIGLTLGNDSILKPFPGSSRGKSYDASRVKKYDETLKEIVEKNSCRFISLANILVAEDFMDGLHPNDKGHSKMFTEIKKFY